jgi:hypothetical protein
MQRSPIPTPPGCRAPARPRRPRRPGRTVAAVALAACLACTGGEAGDRNASDPVSAATAREAEAPRREEHGTVRVRLLEWRIELSHDTVAAGTVAFTIVNAGTHRHAFVLTGPGVDREVPVAAGATVGLEVSLRPGTYEVACGIREGGIDHAGEGMRAVLWVR